MNPVYAMIPARGGSKGIPRKNLAEFGGRPLIAHTIEAALASRHVDRVMVSTEDDEIAEVAQACGAELPFVRPADLATDEAPGDAVSRHWLEWVRDQAPGPWAVVHLQATSPLRTAEDIDRSIELLASGEWPCVASVCPVSDHPAYMYRLVDERAESFLDASALPSHRQRAEELFRLNGAIFATCFEAALKIGKFHARPFGAYVMPAERSIDIDTPLDLAVAETIYRQLVAEGARKGAG